jgi:hypothetical protein
LAHGIHWRHGKEEDGASENGERRRAKEQNEKSQNGRKKKHGEG